MLGSLIQLPEGLASTKQLRGGFRQTGRRVIIACTSTYHDCPFTHELIIPTSAFMLHTKVKWRGMAGQVEVVGITGNQVREVLVLD